MNLVKPKMTSDPDVATRVNNAGEEAVSRAGNLGRDTVSRINESARSRPGWWTGVGVLTTAAAAAAVVYGTAAVRRNRRRPQQRAARAWHTLANRLYRRPAPLINLGPIKTRIAPGQNGSGRGWRRVRS
jgi:hypothetical protein